MESSRSSNKMKVPKVRALNENVSPLQIEIEDQRARYLQSMTMSPRFQPYSENIDVGSPLGRYLFAGSPISGKVAQPYCGNSSGNSSFSSRGRLSLSPLSSVENFEIAPPMSPPMYGTPLKVDEEVLVMDDILVRSTTGGKNGRSSSSSSGRGSSSSSSSPSPWRAWDESGNCRYNSKCQFAQGKKELHPSRLSMMSISEAQAYKSSMSAGSGIYGSNSRTFHLHHAAVVSVATISQPASPVKLEPHHAPSIANSNTFKGWSPLDDGIEVVLPGLDKSPSREEVDAYVSGLLNDLITKRRLPVFEKLCVGQ